MFLFGSGRLWELSVLMQVNAVNLDPGRTIEGEKGSLLVPFYSIQHLVSLCLLLQYIFDSEWVEREKQKQKHLISRQKPSKLIKIFSETILNSEICCGINSLMMWH